jgi:chromosome partitioning protein
MIDDMPIAEAVTKTCVENLDILPSSIDLAGAEVELVYVKNREHVLKRVLEKAKEHYDFITIDCPPSLGLLTINALAGSDTVIIPIQSEYYALEGLSQLMNTIRLVVKHLNPNLKIEGVVLTMNDSRALISKQISAEIRKFFGKRVYDTVIPRNVRLAEAPSHGVPIMLHDTKCTGARAYSAFTEEFLERQPTKVKNQIK